MTALPFDAEIIPAEKRLFEEKIVFVHHFGGNKQSSHRHVRLVNEQGFDAVVFNLCYYDSLKNPNRSLTKNLPITADLHFGARHIWTEQIESLLNLIPGKKIIYSFSMPSNSAVAALANRNAEDVTCMVCDGGPFLQLTRCMWNLYTHQFGVESKLLRGVFTFTSLALYGLGIEREMRAMFERIPNGFPVLSFRADNDRLVPHAAIDEFFADDGPMLVERVTIKNAGHLEGLKTDPERYREALGRFLGRYGSRV